MLSGVSQEKSTPPIVRIFGVSKYYGAQPALSDLSLEVAAGSRTVITGPSGAGKSTLLKLLYLEERATRGEILVDGKNLARIGRRQMPAYRRRIGVVFQDFKLIASRTVFENVALVLEAAGETDATIRKRVNSVLRIAGIEKKADLFPLSLSGGEQQRVAVSRAVVGRPGLLLADEPTASLDPESAERVIELLTTFHEKGTTLMIATHNRELIERLGGTEIRLEGGQNVLLPETARRSSGTS